MATHSSVLAWRIPGTGEPGGLPSLDAVLQNRGWEGVPVVEVSWTLSKSEPLVLLEQRPAVHDCPV